jgi:hypothetical protein
VTVRAGTVTALRDEESGMPAVGDSGVAAAERA